MTVYVDELHYRLRICNKDDDGGLLTFSTLDTDTAPYLQGPPSGDGQRIDPITGKSEIGAYTARVVDAKTRAGRAVTSYLVDTAKRQQQISRRAYIEYSEDGGYTWVVMVAGYVTGLRLVGALTFEYSIGEAQRTDKSREIFKSVTTTYNQVSCICGGPVRGGFGPLGNFGPWKMRVAQVYDDFVRLKFLSGYVRRSIDTYFVQFPTGGYEYVAGGLTTYEDKRVNEISRDFYEPRPGLSSYGIAGWYRGLEARVENASGTVLGYFTPLNRIDSKTQIGSVVVVGTHVALVDNSDLNLLWDGSHGLDSDRAANPPAQPDDESIVYVYVYPTEITADNPIHLKGHPCDIITGLWSDAGFAYSSTAAASAKAANPGLWLNLRVGKSYKLNEFVELLCGLAGLSVRRDDEGKRALVSTRLRSATTPSTIITLDDLRTPAPNIFDVDESKMVNKVTINSERYTLWAPEKFGKDSKRPIDELVVTPIGNSVADDSTEFNDIHEQTYNLPGQILLQGMPSALGDLGWLEPGPDQETAFTLGLALEIFDRRRTGAITGQLDCLRGVDAVPGDEIVIDIDHLPNDNDRGGQRIVQVTGRTETPGGPTLQIEDAGTSVQPSTVPTYTVEKDTTSDPKRFALVTVTNASSLILDGSSCRIEYSIGSSSTDWFHAATLTAAQMDAGATSWHTPQVDAGSVVNVRMRAEEPGKRPSAYGDTESVTLTALTAPSSLSVVAVDGDDTAADASWTAGETMQPVVFEWGATADGVYDHRVVLPAGSTQYPVRGLTPDVGYSFQVYYEELPPWHGKSTAATDTLTTGDSTPTCLAPDNPRAFAGSVNSDTGGLVVDGSYGLEVTARELPSHTVFEEAIEGEGDDLLFDWEPGDSTTGFTRSGAAEYVDSDLEVASASTGVARDSDYSAGERALLLEPARSNSWTYSGDPSNSAWSKNYLDTPTTDGTKAADGSTDAYLVKPSSSSVATHELRRNLPSTTDDTDQTITVEVEPGGYDRIALTLVDKAGAAFQSVVNIANGAIVSRATQHKLVVTPLAGGIYRIALTADIRHGSTTPNFRLRVCSGDSPNMAFAGDGSSGIYVSYIGIEVDESYGTTPIRTTSSTASRSAEALTREDVMDADLGATLYERYYDEATDEVVEAATAVTTTTDVAFTVGRKYFRVKIAEGSFSTEQMRVMTSSGTYGDFTAVPRGTVQSVQGGRTVWRGLAPADGRRRQLRAKATAPGKDDSGYTPVVSVDPWSATKPRDYPVDIPSDFGVGSVVLGSQIGGISYAVATYTPPRESAGFDHMAYSVRSRVTTDGDTAPWSAPTLVVGGAYGSDHIPVTPGTDVEVTPITVSQDGGGKRGSGDQVKTVTVPKYVVGTPSIADPVAGSSSITYEILSFAGAAYIRWWHETFTTSTVPSSAVSVEATGTEGPRFEPGGLTVQQGGSIDSTNKYEIVTFIAYDANNQRGVPISLLTERATPTAPSAPTAAASSHTSGSVTNTVTMPSSITNADKIRIYRDGVKYGADVPRTAGASSAQSVTSDGLTPGTTYQWQYSLVSDEGAESSKSTAFSVTTSTAAIPTPTISLSYSTAAQAFTIHILPGPNSPSGVTWHVKIGTSNPPASEATGSASTSLTLSYPSAQTSTGASYYARVWGTRSGWTASSESAVANALRPALPSGGGGGGGGPPIDPT